MLISTSGPVCSSSQGHALHNQACWTWHRVRPAYISPLPVSTPSKTRIALTWGLSSINSGSWLNQKLKRGIEMPIHPRTEIDLSEDLAASQTHRSFSPTSSKSWQRGANGEAARRNLICKADQGSLVVLPTLKPPRHGYLHKTGGSASSRSGLPQLYGDARLNDFSSSSAL
jgi:hypothetical protein